MMIEPSSLLLRLLLVALVLGVSLAATCDSYALPAETTRAARLKSNTFHKICPSRSSLGAPICGDGTPFSFYYTSPVKRRSSNKIMIEFSGGGACWDANTCQYNAHMLTFPYRFDEFLGLSCSEIAAGMEQSEYKENYGDVPVNMLCSQTVAGVDFRDFHTIIVPYCTQDTHLGSNNITYDDGTTVHHSGAANTMSVLEWVYDNFPRPEHIVLTGCSAGGTVLPVVYDLIHHHYNTWTKGKSLALSTIMDSPVWLTPTYFLEYGLPNWNVQPILAKVHFDFNKYGQSEDLSTLVVEHALKRGSKSDAAGIITHTSDPISLAYFQAMSANADDDDGHRNRRLDEEGVGEEEWWAELSSSLTTVVDSHSNAYSYIIEGEGHCSFGWYYALNEGGDDFQTWAAKIVQVPAKQQSTGQGWLWISLLVGSSLAGVAILHHHRMERLQNDGKVEKLLDSQQRSLRDSIFAGFQHLAGFIAYFIEDAPVTMAYGVAVTIYFLRLMTWDGLEVFIYNPSLGPTAVTLSAFGINNPTLVVYNHEIMRALFTSNFLCSGIVTYAMVIYCLYFHIRRLEITMRAITHPSVGRLKFRSSYFLQVSTLIAVGSNLIYAMIMDGASCSSMALMLGLQAYSCTMHRHYQRAEFPRPYFTTAAFFFLTAFFLPYNNWVMMLSAMLIGIGLAIQVFWIYEPCFVETPSTIAGKNDQTPVEASSAYTSFSEDDSTKMPEDPNKELPKQPGCPQSKLTLLRRNRPLQALLCFYSILIVCLLVKVRRPNRMYQQPFLTGCELVYTTHVDEIAGSYMEGQFASGDGNAQADGEKRGRGRRLQEDNGDNAAAAEGDEAGDEENMCAQFCVPHLVSRAFIWGANIYTGFDVQRGFCEEAGHSQHIADKTFSYKSYSVDVELFYDDNYSGQDNDGDHAAL